MGEGKCQSPLSRLRVLLGLQPLSDNSTRGLLRSGLPAFGATTAVQTPSSLWLDTDLPTPAVYPLRVQRERVAARPGKDLYVV